MGQVGLNMTDVVHAVAMRGSSARYSSITALPVTPEFAFADHSLGLE